MNIFLILLFLVSMLSTPEARYLSRVKVEGLDALSTDINKDPVIATTTPATLGIVCRFILHEADPEQCKTALLNLFDNIKVSTDTRARSITVICPNKQISLAVSSQLSFMDKKLSQIQLQVEVLEVHYEYSSAYRNFLSEIGNGLTINYDFATGKVLSSDVLSASIASLIQNGHAKLLAKPSLLTVDNHVASIKIGDQIPYTTTITHNDTQKQEVHYLDTGIEVQFLPKIATNNRIAVKITSTVNTIKLWKKFGSTELPVLSTRRSDSTVQLRNHETLVIAGLLDENERTNQNRVPILSDIPWIGGLFQSASTENVKSDIVFMVTPLVVE